MVAKQVTDNIEFKCESESLEQIPEEIVARTGIAFPEAHQDKQSMAVLAKELKKYRGDMITRIPFCVTVEAEAFGSEINLGDGKTGPRVRQYRYNNIGELVHAGVIDLTKARIKEVLDCVELLSNEGETVALSVEGPLTIISSLLDPMEFFKGIRQDREQMDKFIQVIEDSIVKYILAGLEKGARIISYADPVGSLDIVGPRVYRELSGKISYNVLKRIEGHLDNVLVHLCGKTSTGLNRIELCTTQALETEAGITYGQALLDALNSGRGIKFIGHRCIKTTPFKLAQPVIWGINL